MEDTFTTIKKLYIYKVKPFESLPTSFPMPMLRRDHSWPREDEDAVKMSAANTDVRDFLDVWGLDAVITLASYQDPNVERWNSFGWEVTAVEVRHI